MRISVTNLHEAITPTEEKDRFKKFQEAEKKRYKAEQQRSVNIVVVAVLRKISQEVRAEIYKNVKLSQQTEYPVQVRDEAHEAP